MSGSDLIGAITLALCSASLVAQSSPPVVDASLRNRFGFEGPKVHKVGDGIGLLQAVDLDRDGDDELIVNHPARGRLAILERGEHDSVAEEYIDTDGSIFGLGIADFDADGVMDFAMLNSRGRLVLRLRGPAAEARPEVEVGTAATGDALRLGDVDGDGQVDAVVLLSDGVRVITDLRGEAKLSRTMPLDFERARSFLLEDIDGDGNLDVVVLTGRAGMPLHVKLGEGGAKFGPWLLFRTPVLHRAFRGPGLAGKPSLMVVQDRRARIVDYELRHRPADDGAIAPQLTSLHELKRGAFPHAHGDLDGDGDLDLVLAHPDRAELVFLIEQDGGFASAMAVPSLAGITSIAIGDFDHDGKNDVILASPEEETIAWKSGAQPIETFPTRLPSSEKPLAVAVAADGAVLCISKDKKRQGTLLRVVHGAEAVESIGDLGKLGGDPQRLLIGDVDQRPGDELVFVVPGEGLRVVRFVDGKAELAEGGTSAGFTKQLADGEVNLVTVDGRTALLAVRQRFARMFRLDAAGEIAIERQLNGPSDASELALGTLFSDGRSLLVDSKANKLHVDRPGAAPTSYDLPPFGVTHILEHHGAALLIGRSGVVRMPFGESWTLHALRDHEPPTEDTNYWTGVSADFDGDGEADAALLDEDINGVQVLVARADGLHRALGFPVFELPEKRDQVYEPREIVAGDWDGDGRQDIILISHDRVLVYRQEK